MEGILRVQYKILLDLPPHFTKQPEINYPPDGLTSDRRKSGFRQYIDRAKDWGNGHENAGRQE